ncbi:FAD binding domain-containing protein [Paenibacillus turpanensis]|uniref:FAD binding domain-containing protein n=1 Tax=Paenibacillus turpanensis TaxID=2689078 RepID=UPI00140B20AC|nr:FAD binding domain-containing protein [Paenibacillus turpanensis]
MEHEAVSKAVPQEAGRTPGEAKVYRPNTPEDAWKWMRTLGEGAKLSSGATLLRYQWESGAAEMPSYLISLDSVAAMKTIIVTDTELVIGAGVTLSELTLSSAVKAASPLLYTAARSVGAPSIRNMATIGGNVAWLIGDTIPALLASEASVVVWTESGRSLLLLEAWLKGRSQAPGGAVLIEKIIVPVSKQKSELLFYQKVGRRETFTPSVVTVAASGNLDEHGCLVNLRFAAGGGATEVTRLHEVERAAEGRRPEEAVTSVYHAMVDTFDPVSDAFAPASYRKKVAANLAASELLKLSRRKAEWSELA